MPSRNYKYYVQILVVSWDETGTLKTISFTLNYFRTVKNFFSNLSFMRPITVHVLQNNIFQRLGILTFFAKFYTKIFVLYSYFRIIMH